MSNENLLPNEMDLYKIKALKMMDVYESERKEIFFKWFNRFEYVAEIIGIPENKMIEFFNKMVHDDVHNRVKESDPHVDFSKLSYEQLAHFYYSKVSSSFSHGLRSLYMLNLLEREEKALEDAAKLRDKILSSQFIEGVQSDEIRKYLKEHPYDTFEETVAKATELENAQK